MDLDGIEHYKGEEFDGTDAYANTKRAQVYLTELWAKRYSNVNPVNFYSMHPGWARTPGTQKSLPPLFDKLNLREPAQGADTGVWLSVADKASIKQETGLFYFDREPVEYVSFAKTFPFGVVLD